MDDGVHLRADMYYPVDPTTKKRASGKFPVLLEQTPYGKDRIARGSANTAKYFVSRGYIFAVADLRGFGNSQGQASWFGSRMGQDGAKLVQWAAHLESSSGKAGLTGCSYSGVAQYFTANSLSASSPVKAMAPFCTDSNFYRDLTAFGGIPTQFIAAVRALTPPGVDDNPATDPFMQTMISQGTGENAYYNDYWESLNVTRFMPKIVSLGIPVLSETGWYDLFPGANIDATLAAQNSVGTTRLINRCDPPMLHPDAIKRSLGRGFTGSTLGIRCSRCCSNGSTRGSREKRPALPIQQSLYTCTWSAQTIGLIPQPIRSLIEPLPFTYRPGQ